MTQAELAEIAFEVAEKTTLPFFLAVVKDDGSVSYSTNVEPEQLTQLFDTLATLKEQRQ
jgi:hypothetical protein